MLKLCRYCNVRYPEKDFGVAATMPNKVYRRHKCRYCYRETKRLLVKRRRAWIEEYKRQRKCSKCGITDFRVLDFHHNGISEKDFNISDFRYKAGLERLKEEIKKCELLCANCHRISHHESNESRLVLMDDSLRGLAQSG